MLNLVTIEDIRNEFADLYNKGIFVTDKSGVKTLEIVNACFIANEESIFGKPNEDYIRRELAWYESQSLNVNDIPAPVPEIWKKCATPEGLINSNYGYMIYSEGNGFQYSNVLKTLLNFPDSRRAEMIYTRPEMHFEYATGGMSDFCCTEAVQYLIRDNKLHTIVKMRSNDAWAGYRNDYAWQVHVRNKLLRELNEVGNSYERGLIYWNAGSLHIYEKQHYLVKHYSDTGEIYTLPFMTASNIN